MPKKAKAKQSATPLAQKIANHRQQRALTMQQLAHELNISESYISFLESGVRSPSRKLLKNMVQFFYPQGNPALLDEWLMLAGFSPENLNAQSPKKDAERIWREQIAAAPNDLRTRFAFVRNLLKEGELDKAQSLIQESFQTFTTAVEVQSLLGSLELARKNYANAILAFQTAISFRQQDTTTQVSNLSEVDLLLSLGVTYCLRGHSHQEMYYQSNKTKADQKHFEAAQQDFEQGKATFQAALKIDPLDIYVLDEYARVCFNLGHLMRLKGRNKTPSKKEQAYWNSAIEAYHQVIQHAGNTVLGVEALLEASVFLGFAYCHAGQFEQAQTYLALTQALRPEHWLPHYARACASALFYEKSGGVEKLDAALQHLSHALAMHDAPLDFIQNIETDPDLEALRREKASAIKRLFSQLKREHKTGKA